MTSRDAGWAPRSTACASASHAGTFLDVPPGGVHSTSRVEGPWRGSKKQGARRSGGWWPARIASAERHVVAALFERRRHRFELSRLGRAIVRAGRLVVGIERLRVLGFCLRIRFDRLLELLHVVGEGDQVVVRRGLDLRELGLVLSSFPHAAEDEEDDASCDEQGDQGASAARPDRRHCRLRHHSSRRSAPSPRGR